MSNFISVIVPVYNTGVSLEKCLSTLCNQSFRDLCIYIVDNASTDSTTISIINNYIKNYDNICLFKNAKNLGPGEARNIGIANSNSEYIAFLDSDDWVDIDTYEKCRAHFEKNEECDVAIFNIITEYNNFVSGQNRYHNIKNQIDGTMALSMLTNFYRCNQAISPMVGNKVFHRTFLINNNLRFPKGYYEDDYFMFMCFKFARKILLIDDCALHYYQREKSIMHTVSKKHITDLIRIFALLKKQLIANHEFDKYKSIFYSYYERCIRSFLNQIFESNLSNETLKKYIKLLTKMLIKNISIDEFIDYIDLIRIKNFFT